MSKKFGKPGPGPQVEPTAPDLTPSTAEQRIAHHNRLRFDRFLRKGGHTPYHRIPTHREWKKAGSTGYVFRGPGCPRDATHRYWDDRREGVRWGRDKSCAYCSLLGGRDWW